MNFIGGPPMKPRQKSQTLLSATRSKAKMIEYAVPPEEHIELYQDPAKLFRLSLGILGDLVASSNRANEIPHDTGDFRETLNFSARFFDAFLQSKLNTSLDPYVILLSSAAYYLSDLPGAARVLAHQLPEECPNLEGDGLEDLVLWLLRGDVSFYWESSYGYFQNYVVEITKSVHEFFQGDSDHTRMFELATALRKLAYDAGTPRQLLLADVSMAIIRKKYQNSVWYAVPNYSQITVDEWRPAFAKDSFIKELWPAQHLLGQHNVLSGASAVVQMPTSAGKTKATELIIRSAFLSGRTKLAVIIAPFRALCHEIKNSLLAAFKGERVNVDALSDILQTDFDLSDILGGKQILVVTPEKLVYVLRHAPELATHIGLVVFDEGHQFDSGKRGITYELLVTSLQSMLPEDAQKILISAVISNAAALGEWLNGADSEIVVGTNLLPTLRSVGFASWLDRRGQIQFVDNHDPEKQEFFVPRVLEQSRLGAKPKETNPRFFPEKEDGKSIALYMGLKLVQNGGIAIFCGRKDTAGTLCQQAVDIFSRGGLPMKSPASISDAAELTKLHYLFKKNLGTKAAATNAALLGIFPHHGNTPHGIRLAVEHAMREALIHFVVCTSTLAQGVNLPIRYLIVTSVYQGEDPIKVRDFHNLIGRAGRAGMHTEGSVLFADPIVYDTRKVWAEKWRWEQMKTLLDPSNSEPCISNLLSIFEPIKNDRGNMALNMGAMDFARAYIRSPSTIAALAKSIAQQNAGFSERRVQEQITEKILSISAIESFLMSNWEPEETVENVVALAESTLAYFLADANKKQLIKELFELLANNIEQNVVAPERKKVFGRTLYGVPDLQEIEEWIDNNLDDILECDSPESALDLIWDLLQKHVQNKNFRNCDTPDALKTLADHWIQGISYDKLLSTLENANAKRIWGQKRRKYSVDDVVDMTEGGIAYDGSLFVGAVAELTGMVELEDDDESIDDFVYQLELLQKRIKYGLPNEACCNVYELGFADRVIAQDLANKLNLTDENRKRVKRAINRDRDLVSQVLEKYPSFFSERLADID
jgi:superfamily II DNA/RNA helicase